MGEIKPLSPLEVKAQKLGSIPDVVITAVNNLLVKNYNNSGYITLLQDDIISEIIRLDSSIQRKVIFDNKWLDFEDIFRKANWNVKYDQPAYNENYPSKYIFEVKKLKN